MKFKQYIQSEINQKEVEPSHDAWDRIQARMENQAPVVVIEKSSKKWWAVAAVVIGLAVCTTVYFTLENKNAPSKFVNEDTKTVIENPSNPSIVEQSSTELLNAIKEAQQTEIVESKTKVSSTVHEMENDEKQIVLNQTTEINTTVEPQNQMIQQPALTSSLKQSSTPQQMATNLDTVKVSPKKKGNYVDPSMLLYSIENKEALKETQKEKTRVAVIDLNK